jgi:hypothetical protein
MSDIIKDKSHNYKNAVKAALTEQSSRDHLESNGLSPVSKHRTSVVMDKKFNSNKSEKTNIIKSESGSKKKNIGGELKNDKGKKNSSSIV